MGVRFWHVHIYFLLRWYSIFLSCFLYWFCLHFCKIVIFCYFRYEFVPGQFWFKGNFAKTFPLQFICDQWSRYRDKVTPPKNFYFLFFAFAKAKTFFRQSIPDQWVSRQIILLIKGLRLNFFRVLLLVWKFSTFQFLLLLKQKPFPGKSIHGQSVRRNFLLRIE